MNKTEASEIVRALRAAARDHECIDVYTDQAGNFFAMTAGAEFIGRYTTDATAKQLASDILFIGGQS